MTPDRPLGEGFDAAVERASIALYGEATPYEMEAAGEAIEASGGIFPGPSQVAPLLSREEAEALLNPGDPSAGVPPAPALERADAKLRDSLRQEGTDG